MAEDMIDLAPLLERLERADGAERMLDGAIYWYLLEPNRDEFRLDWRELQFSTDKGNGDWRKPYTSSIDAAVELVMSKLPGTEWAISTLNDNNHAEVDMNAQEPVTAQGATPALALCTALVRSLIGQGVTDDHG